MTRYPNRKLGEFFRIGHGFAFKGEYFSKAGKYILLTPGNFSAGSGLILKGSKEKFYTGPFPPSFILKKGELIIALTDLTQSAPLLGAPAIVPENNRYLHNQRLGRVHGLDESGLDRHYLYYLLQHPQVRAQIKATATGATVRHTAPERIYTVECPVPSIGIQVRVASFLRSYDDLIENNTRRIAILEEMARALYREWFVEFRFPGHVEVTMKKSPLGLVPSSWRVQTTAETFEYVGGSTPSKDVQEYWEGGTIEWFTPTDLTRSKTMFTEASGTRISPIGLAKSSAKIFPALSVMMTSRATIGVTAINVTPACTNQGFITCIPSPRFPLYLLYHWMRHNVEYFISLGTGSTFKELTRSAFKSIPILVPPESLVSRFQAGLEPVGKQILALQRKNANLRTTRDLLLPKLISGELDISRLPELNPGS